MMRPALLLSFGLVAVAACAARDAAPYREARTLGSCDRRGVKDALLPTCVDFVGPQWTDKIDSICVFEGEVYSPAACPRKGVQFSCLLDGGAPTEVVHRYYGKAAQARKLCQGIGAPF